MKEPNEVKSMQDTINRIYQNKKNSKVKGNYKNIDVLPTVYDTPDENSKEGFKGFFKSIGKGFKQMGKPFKKWKAPYTGPPLDGPIKDIDHNEANNINNIILKGESLLNFFTNHEQNLNDMFGSNKTKSKRSFGFQDAMGPFAKCPCVKIYPFNVHKLSYWHQFIAFFTDSIPCLIDEYSDLLVRMFTTEKEYVIKQDKETVKSSVIEFFYIFIAGYLSMMFFYYSVMDTSNFVNPAEFVPKTGNQSFDFYVVDRLVEYMILPIKMFNEFFTTVLPGVASMLGVLPFAKLNYIFLFMVSIAMVFNGIIETFADMAKKSFQFKAHMIIYAFTALAVVIKLFDLEIIYNIKEYMALKDLWYIYIPLVIVMIIIAFVFAPFTQLMLVIYVFNLFFLRPLMHLFEELNLTAEFLFDPSNDLSCDLPTGEFFGELSRIISKYIFPIMFPLVLMIFFAYRFYLSGSLYSTALRSIMYMVNLVCIILVLAYIFFIVDKGSRMSRNVDIETRFDTKGQGQEPEATYGDPIKQSADTPVADLTADSQSLKEAISKEISDGNVITSSHNASVLNDPVLENAIETEIGKKQMDSSSFTTN